MLCCFIRQACTELCMSTSEFQLHKYKIVLLKKSVCAASCLVVCIFFLSRHCICCAQVLKCVCDCFCKYILPLGLTMLCEMFADFFTGAFVIITLLMMRTCSRNLVFVSFLFVSLCQYKYKPSSETVICRQTHFYLPVSM